jgi:small subunit ribosomal protein S16
METKIRMARFGAKKRPFYRIVVTTSTSPRNGRFLEVVGHYDPSRGIAEAKVVREKINAWIKKGAKTSELVGRILKTAAG